MFLAHAHCRSRSFRMKLKWAFDSFARCSLVRFTCFLDVTIVFLEKKSESNLSDVFAHTGCNSYLVIAFYNTPFLVNKLNKKKKKKNIVSPPDD